MQNLKKCDAQYPDGTLVFRIFEAAIQALSLFDGHQETRDFSEALESFSGFLAEINQHIFQEVWTHKIEFFVEQARKRPALCQICVFLTLKEHLSPALTSIILRYLVDRLPLLGNEPKDSALVTIRMYKLAFNAVSQYPVLNEPILAAHLGKLIMDCFPLAAKSTSPTNYFLLLRSLFRAIAQGGGKFEQLYKEVLPLLPDMLECLNRHLHASEGEARDMIVELCLTVPLRLTHLLPHLTYLMQPLAMALRGPSGSELVTQGLRTLELCIDNLTPDFLDPTLNTVLRELMEALHTHLKPLPAHHVQSHTTIRILGKLGGRNRKLMYQPPALTYHDHIGSATMPISFGGIRKEITLAPMSLLAAQEVAKPSAPSYRDDAYKFASNCLVYILDEVSCRHPLFMIALSEPLPMIACT
jgi:transformation/transcription domain-associated protein